MAKKSNFVLDDDLPDVQRDEVEAFKAGVNDTTVRSFKKGEESKAKKRVFERYTFSLTSGLSRDIDKLSYMPRDFRANRSDVIKAAVNLLNSLPKKEIIEQLIKVK